MHLLLNINYINDSFYIKRNNTQIIEYYYFLLTCTNLSHFNGIDYLFGTFSHDSKIIEKRPFFLFTFNMQLD